MKIVIVSSEVSPFAKTGGLGDVAGSLPKALKKLNQNCVIVMPKFKEIDEVKFRLKKLEQNLVIPVGDRMVEAGIFKTEIDNNIPVYFIDNKDYYCRDKLYEINGEDYPDNAERFAFFSRGCLQLLKKTGIRPDVIHCNDWQTSLIPVYLKTLYKEDDYFKNTRSLLTIHNIAFQGLFDVRYLNVIGLGNEIFTPEGIEFYGKINLLKGGIVFSDMITAVSKTYAAEIQTEEFGCGLSGVLQNRNGKLFGIINGIDEDEWNPVTDKYIAGRYSVADLSGKVECKKDLASIFNLEFKSNVPTIGIISRLDEQKGFDLIEDIMDDLMKLDVQMCLLGVGKGKYHTFFSDMASWYKGRVGVRLTFDNVLAHKIEAGADMFFMPSKYEPCGMGQLYSLKYGTIPIVSSTGGLADTIIEYDPVNGSGNGFKFEPYSSSEFFKKVIAAINMYHDKKNWQKLMRNAMNKDFTWNKSALEYLELYKKLKIKG